MSVSGKLLQSGLRYTKNSTFFSFFLFFYFFFIFNQLNGISPNTILLHIKFAQCDYLHLILVKCPAQNEWESAFRQIVWNFGIW